MEIDPVELAIERLNGQLEDLRIKLGESALRRMAAIERDAGEPLEQLKAFVAYFHELSKLYADAAVLGEDGIAHAEAYEGHRPPR